jgi:hypothetical protein
MKILRWLKFWKLPKKIWIPLLLAIPVLLYFAFKPATPKEPTVTTLIKKTDIRSTISGSGTLTGANSATLKFGQWRICKEFLCPPKINEVLEILPEQTYK